MSRHVLRSSKQQASLCRVCRCTAAAITRQRRNVQAYRDENLTLDHLTAFAVTEDREPQERVFGQLQTWQRNPDTIRRLLTYV